MEVYAMSESVVQTSFNVEWFNNKTNRWEWMHDNRNRKCIDPVEASSMMNELHLKKPMLKVRVIKRVETQTVIEFIDPKF